MVVEQAKGVLANHGHLDMQQAFNALRRYARDRNERLSDVAAGVVSRQLAPQAVLFDSLRRSRATVPKN